jgi:hypothetical protein
MSQSPTGSRSEVLESFVVLVQDVLDVESLLQSAETMSLARQRLERERKDWRKSHPHVDPYSESLTESYRASSLVLSVIPTDR